MKKRKHGSIQKANVDVSECRVPRKWVTLSMFYTVFVFYSLLLHIFPQFTIFHLLVSKQECVWSLVKMTSVNTKMCQ